MKTRRSGRLVFFYANNNPKTRDVNDVNDVPDTAEIQVWWVTAPKAPPFSPQVVVVVRKATLLLMRVVNTKGGTQKRTLGRKSISVRQNTFEEEQRGRGALIESLVTVVIH